MAKSKRRFSAPSVGGGARPQTPRRAFRPSDVPEPPPLRPPVGGAGQRSVVASPRPLTPEAPTRRGPIWLTALGPQRLVIGLAVLAVLAAVGLLLYAYYDQQIAPRRALALRVGDKSYSMEYFARRYGAVVEDANQEQIRNGLLTTLPDLTREALTTDALILQRAETEGVSASDAEIDRMMLKLLNVPVVAESGEEARPEDPLTVTPGMRNAIRQELRDNHVTLGVYRETAHAQVLKEKLQQRFLEQVPREGPQVRIRVLQLPSESDARIAIQKIRSGENTLAELADSVTLDPLGKGRGGLRDWQPRGILPPALEEAAFSLPLNTLSEPIDSGVSNGWFVIQTEERVENREIAEDVRKQLAANRTRTWYEEQLQALTVENALTEEKIRWAFQYAAPDLPTVTPGGGSNLPGISVPGQNPGTPALPPGIPGVPPAPPAGQGTP